MLAIKLAMEGIATLQVADDLGVAKERRDIAGESMDHHSSRLQPRTQSGRKAVGYCQRWDLQP
jgi:hypothetical protein